MSAWYNEFDPKKAAWLRELIERGMIAPGDVDERSIADVRPDDLRGYTQCHFFAGIGIWSYALRLAVWPDDREVWTGSCPCQPFSAAGKGEAFDDERHLWPEFFRLIEARRPVVCFGEQVASIDGLAWLDIVQSDLDRADYTCGAVDLCAAGFGAPHRRQRLYWVADTIGAGGHNGRRERGSGYARGSSERGGAGDAAEKYSDAGGLADSSCDGRGAIGRDDGSHERNLVDSGSEDGRMDHADINRAQRPGGAERIAQPRCATERMGDSENSEWGLPVRPESRKDIESARPGPVNGFWRSADWVLTRPQRVGDRPGLRPVERGAFPLAHGASARVGRLRGYGDGIVAQVAKGFIEAYLDETK